MNNFNKDTVGTAVQLLSFDNALVALKRGLMIRRYSWSQGTFIFQQVPSRVPNEVIPKMSSLPEAVKSEFQRRERQTTSEAGDAPHNHSTIDYKNQIAIVHPDNHIFGYCPSCEDILSDDWVIIG